MLFRAAHPLLVAVIILLVSVLPFSNGQSYWTVYEGDAPAECVVEAGEMVDETCCTAKPPQGFITDFFSSTCFVIRGLLEGGLALESYLGCDDGEIVYGEACYNNGENGGIIPNGTLVDDFNATDITECGCQFQVSGNGCHKIRDFSSLPGFEADTRQVFVLLNETCPAVTTSGTLDSVTMGDLSILLGAAVAMLVAVV